jgi:hypothetical protein
MSIKNSSDATFKVEFAGLNLRNNKIKRPSHHLSVLISLITCSFLFILGDTGKNNLLVAVCNYSGASYFQFSIWKSQVGLEDMFKTIRNIEKQLSIALFFIACPCKSFKAID